MKKRYSVLISLLMVMFLVFTGNTVSARTSVKNENTTNIVNEVLANTKIYDDGKIVVEYKYGLRRINVYYCQKGEACDSNNYTTINVMESSVENPYKNVGEEMDTYSYQLKLTENVEYRVKVEIYVGSSTAYTGVETVHGLSIDTIDTENTYIKLGNDGIRNENVNDLMDKLTLIVNSVILPLIFSVLTIVFVVKGAILGVQIVRSADQPQERAEKVHALKWLVIGVFIAYAASSLVGWITGYFETIF